MAEIETRLSEVGNVEGRKSHPEEIMHQVKGVTQSIPELQYRNSFSLRCEIRCSIIFQGLYLPIHEIRLLMAVTKNQ